MRGAAVRGGGGGGRRAQQGPQPLLFRAQRQDDAEERAALGEVFPQEASAHFKEGLARSKEAEARPVLFGGKEPVPQTFRSLGAEARAVVADVIGEGVRRADKRNPHFRLPGAQGWRGKGFQRVAYQIEQAGFEAFGVQRDGRPVFFIGSVLKMQPDAKAGGSPLTTSRAGSVGSVSLSRNAVSCPICSK